MARLLLGNICIFLEKNFIGAYTCTDHAAKSFGSSVTVIDYLTRYYQLYKKHQYVARDRVRVGITISTSTQ